MTLNPMFSKDRPEKFATGVTAIFSVYAASLPFSTVQILPGFSLSFALGIISAVVGVSFVIHNRSSYYKNASTDKFLIIGALLSFVLLSLFSGVMHQSSKGLPLSIVEALDVTMLTNVCMLWLLLAVHSIQPQLISKTMLAFLLSSTLIALFLILTWLHFRTELNDIFLYAKVVDPWENIAFSGHVSQSGRFTVFGINENTLAYTFLYSWGVAFWFFETKRELAKISRLLFSASIIILGFAIILTGTRSTLITFPIVALLLFGGSWFAKSAVVDRVTMIKVIVLLVIGKILGFFAIGVAFARLEAFLNFFIPSSAGSKVGIFNFTMRRLAEENNSNFANHLNLFENQNRAMFGGREELWLKYMEQVLDKYIFGIGHLGQKHTFGDNYSSHNLLIDVFIQGGLIGISLWLFIIAALTYRLVSNLRSKRTFAGLALFIILASHAMLVPTIFSKIAFFIFAVIYLVSTSKTFRPDFLKNT